MLGRCTWLAGAAATLLGLPLWSGCASGSAQADASIIGLIDAGPEPDGRLPVTDGRTGPDAPGAGGVVTLASGGCPEDVAVDSTNVYWLDSCNHALMMAPTGGGTPTTITSSITTPGAIAVYGGDVYYTEANGTVNRVANSGGKPSMLFSGGQSPLYIAVDSVHAFWSDSGAGTVSGVPIGGGASFTLASGQANVGHVVIDPTYIYWVDVGTGSNDGSVTQLQFGPHTPVVLATGQAKPGALAVGPNNVYWGVNAAAGGSIMKIPIAGGTSTKVTDTTALPEDLVVDGGNLYWVGNDAAVYRAPTGGGASVMVASSGNYNTCVALAVDATSVYWACAHGSSNTGAILKAAK